MLEIIALTAIATSRVAFVKDKICVTNQFFNSITSSLSANGSSAECLTLRKFLLFSDSILVKLVDSVAYLAICSQHVVVFVWKFAVLFDVIKHSLHLALRWQSKYNFSV